MMRLLYTLCLLMLSGLCQAAMQASVDRTQLIEGESLELTLESNAGSKYGPPDFTPLQEHFEVRQSHQLSLLSELEGRKQWVNRWVVALEPKRTGFVIIPPLFLGPDSSEPITLRVLTAQQAEDDEAGTLAPIFIDSEVDTETPYVQAQVLLTLRIYHSVSLYDDSDLSGLDISNTRIERLGAPRNYERTINGVLHGVIEVRYAIFPQQSGELDIPSQLFSATVQLPRNPADPASPHSARMVQLRSPSLQLQVRPVPADYPPDALWLPAKQVRLSQNWQPDPDQDLLRGEPLTRTLSIQADGLTASQLPELGRLSDQQADELRQYNDQPQLENQLSVNGILGLRQESSALVARSPGQLTVPAVSVPWWNTTTDSLEEASLAAVKLNILGSQAASNGNNGNERIRNDLPAPLVWPWQLACALLLAALAATVYRLRQLRTQLHSQDELHEDVSHLDTDAQGNPLADLQVACRQNHPAEARKALEHWAKQQESDLIALSQQYPTLADALDDLNTCLFGQNDNAWRGKPLWRAVRQVTQSRQREAAEASEGGMQPLYPDV
ncbi:MAG: BatD family protein [Halopseudomonas sp.]|uniref:BatD family protein n=1 Tax=Halopseudomonas sp. TaxID=2901191 RepID=UPI0030025828